MMWHPPQCRSDRRGVIRQAARGGHGRLPSVQLSGLWLTATQLVQDMEDRDAVPDRWRVWPLLPQDPLDQNLWMSKISMPLGLAQAVALRLKEHFVPRRIV